MEKRNRKEKSYRLLDESIRAAYLEILESEKRIASQEEIASKVGITARTVRNHLSNVRIGEAALPFRVFTNDVLISLKNRALSGDVQAIKLFFNLTYDWNAKIEPEAGNENEEDTLLRQWLEQGRKLLVSLRQDTASTGELSEGRKLLESLRNGD
jgi:hypothetical protein